MKTSWAVPKEVFMTFRTRNTFQFALSAALQTRRPVILRHLLDSHGRHAFALAIASKPIRQIADVLSLLPLADQTAICLQLSLTTRNQLAMVGISCLESDALAHRTLKFEVLGKWLCCVCTSGISRLRVTPRKRSWPSSQANQLYSLGKE